MKGPAPTASKAAIDILVRDYANYHLVFAIGGALVVMAAFGLAALSVRALARLKHTRPAHGIRFARWTYTAAAAAGLLTGAGMAVLVLANLGNALHPAAGFADAIKPISGQRAPSQRSAVQDAGAAWMASGEAAMPVVLRRAIEARLAWQAPKAALSLTGLTFAAVFSVQWWNRLLKRARQTLPLSRFALTMGVAVGCLMALIVLLLIVLTLANLQASIAPIVLTLIMG
ncbi:hypothetical protein [Caulobacter sp.]